MPIQEKFSSTHVQSADNGQARKQDDKNSRGDDFAAAFAAILNALPPTAEAKPIVRRANAPGLEAIAKPDEKLVPRPSASSKASQIPAAYELIGDRDFSAMHDRASQAGNPALLFENGIDPSASTADVPGAQESPIGPNQSGAHSAFDPEINSPISIPFDVPAVSNPAGASGSRLSHSHGLRLATPNDGNELTRASLDSANAPHQDIRESKGPAAATSASRPGSDSPTLGDHARTMTLQAKSPLPISSPVGMPKDRTEATVSTPPKSAPLENPELRPLTKTSGPVPRALHQSTPFAPTAGAEPVTLKPSTRIEAVAPLRHPDAIIGAPPAAQRTIINLELGKGDAARANIREHAGQVAVRIVTNSQPIAARLGGEVDSLRRALDAGGLRLASADVSYQGERGSSRREPEHQAERREPSAAHGGVSTFEVNE